LQTYSSLVFIKYGGRIAKKLPFELISTFFFEQKLNYTHNNLVEASIVYEPHEYVYSSALDYCGGKGLVKIEMI
jgi:hypothetical protein